MDKKERKLIGGNTLSPNELQFCFIKRFKDGKKREIIVDGKMIDSEKGNIKFSVDVKKKSVFLNIIMYTLELLLLIYFRKFMIALYCIILSIQLLAFIICDKALLKQLHGAEHMVLNFYISENSKIKNIDTVKKYSIISDECGSVYFTINIVSLIIIICTKLPIVLGIMSYILFKVKIIRKIFSFLERFSVGNPNDKQLYLSSVTFNLLIDILEKDLEEDDEIMEFIREYEKKYNQFENDEIFSI